MLVATGFVLRIAFTVAAFLASVLLARLLVPHELGRYFEALAWANIMLSLSQSGLGNFAVKEVAALRARKEYGRLRGAVATVHGVTLLAAGLAALALGTYATLLAPSAERQTYAIACAVIVALSVSSISEAVTKGLGRAIRGQIAETVVRPFAQLSLLSALFFGVLSVRPTAEAAMAILLLAAGSGAAVAFVIERRSLAAVAGSHPGERFGVRSAWSSLGSNALIGWSMAVNTTVGVIVLGLFDQQASVAEFRLMQQFGALIVFGQAVAGSLLSWRLSDAHNRGDRAGLQAVATTLCNLSVLVALPLFIIFVVAGQWLVEIAYGPVYATGHPILLVLCLGYLANSLFAANSILGISAGQERFTAGVHIVGAGLNLCLCLALIPTFGALGAAAAFAISYLVWNLWLFVALRRRTGIAAVAGPVAGERLVSLRHFWPAGA